MRAEAIRYPERLPGRQLKRMLNGYSREAETGHLLA